jgi:hypothetical protein
MRWKYRKKPPTGTLILIESQYPLHKMYLIMTTDDITIWRHCKTEFPNRKLDEVSVPFEDVDETEKKSSYKDSFPASTDRDTEVQKAADACNYEKFNIQFGPAARGTLLPVATYEDRLTLRVKS